MDELPSLCECCVVFRIKDFHTSVDTKTTLIETRVYQDQDFQGNKKEEIIRNSLKI